MRIRVTTPTKRIVQKEIYQNPFSNEKTTITYSKTVYNHGPLYDSGTATAKLVFLMVFLPLLWPRKEPDISLSQLADGDDDIHSSDSIFATNSDKDLAGDTSSGAVEE